MKTKAHHSASNTTNLMHATAWILFSINMNLPFEMAEDRRLQLQPSLWREGGSLPQWQPPPLRLLQPRTR